MALQRRTASQDTLPAGLLAGRWTFRGILRGVGAGFASGGGVVVHDLHVAVREHGTGHQRPGNHRQGYGRKLRGSPGLPDRPAVCCGSFCAPVRGHRHGDRCAATRCWCARACRHPGGNPGFRRVGLLERIVLRMAPIPVHGDSLGGGDGRIHSGCPARGRRAPDVSEGHGLDGADCHPCSPSSCVVGITGFPTGSGGEPGSFGRPGWPVRHAGSGGGLSRLPGSARGQRDHGCRLLLPHRLGQ